MVIQQYVVQIHTTVNLCSKTCQTCSKKNKTVRPLIKKKLPRRTALKINLSSTPFRSTYVEHTVGFRIEY